MGSELEYIISTAQKVVDSDQRDNRWSSGYERAYSKNRDRHFQHYKAIVDCASDLIELPDAATIVEIGSGDMRFHPYLPADTHLIAIDPYKSVSRQGQWYQQVDYNPSAGPGYPDISDEEIDGIVGISSFHFLDRLPDRFAEFRRILKRGGTVTGIEIMGPGSIYLHGLSFELSDHIGQTLSDEYGIYGGEPGNIVTMLHAAVRRSIDELALAAMKYGEKYEKSKMALEMLYGFSAAFPELPRNIENWAARTRKNMPPTKEPDVGTDTLRKIFFEALQFYKQMSAAQAKGYPFQANQINMLQISWINLISDAYAQSLVAAAEQNGFSTSTRRVMAHVQNDPTGMIVLDGFSIARGVKGATTLATGRVFTATKEE
ncbi:MAG: class I SAM-dependent methyltransferase [Candidatus Roizmanbacteria bacterium]|nr:class I SAM-dependent methyltransferase [Candidatus Roizmanbacteria bacterium]